MQSTLSLALVAMIAAVANAAVGTDYITEAPATVYEDEMMSPQNMDFDKANNMFTAHSGWYNDKLIHYYKFRMYTPSTYPGLITPGSSAADVPLQKIYMVTTTGNFTGVVGMPIIEYHTADGNSYSDFMEVVFVSAPADYMENTYKSVGDITASGAMTTSSGVILNIPVVPTGAKLQDPATKGMNAAPISAVPVWYKGVEVHTYVFEVTTNEAKEFFSTTRENPSDFAYEITVTPFASSNFKVSAIPLWHFNQFTAGVSADLGNFGGPNPAGMRNVINLDRPDDGYSPLWRISWMTVLPPNYSADQVSNSRDLTANNGFGFTGTPMFVNCPDIGDIGTVTNPNKLASFETKIDPTQDTILSGSHLSLIMQNGVHIEFQLPNGTEIAHADTNMMGAFELKLSADTVPAGISELNVFAKDNVINTLVFKTDASTPAPTPEATTASTTATTPTSSAAYVSVLFSTIGALLFSLLL